MKSSGSMLLGRRRTGLSLALTLIILCSAVSTGIIIYKSSTANEVTKIFYTTTEGNSQIVQGRVIGYVKATPFSPACGCTVNTTGYNLEFDLACSNYAGTPPGCGLPYYAQLLPSGHYSITLAPGEYMITALLPYCYWFDCSPFPIAVQVTAGHQIVENINVF